MLKKLKYPNTQNFNEMYRKYCRRQNKTMLSLITRLYSFILAITIYNKKKPYNS